MGRRAGSSVITRPAIRYHGAKFRLAPWVTGFFPPHMCYVESFGGAAGVLLQKQRSYAEVYNDLGGVIVNFFRVLRDLTSREQLIQSCAMTPYARDEFDLSWKPCEDAIERARRLAVRAQMGFGSAGASKGVTGFRVDTKRAYGTSQQHWAEYPDALAEVGRRFTGVLIENKPAVDVMRAHDAPTTLHYVDPPYVHSTRVRGASHARYYRHEMEDQDHVALLQELRKLEGMVVLSGYPSEIYMESLGDWERHQTTARISAGRGGAVRTECIWLNPLCSAALAGGGHGLFAGASSA